MNLRSQRGISTPIGKRKCKCKKKQGETTSEIARDAESRISRFDDSTTCRLPRQVFCALARCVCARTRATPLGRHARVRARVGREDGSSIGTDVLMSVGGKAVRSERPVRGRIMQIARTENRFLPAILRRSTSSSSLSLSLASQSVFKNKIG